MTPTSNPTVLLLPGMTLNATIFPAFVGAAGGGGASIEADFTTLVASPDGDLPAGVSRGMDLYADLLDELLARHEAWKTPNRLVVAHSFGGMLALWWLLRHQCRGSARIDGLVLLATTAGPMFDAVSMRVAKLGPIDLRMPVTQTVRWWNRPAVTRFVKRLHSGGTLEIRRVDFQQLKRNSDLAMDWAGWRNTDWRAMRTFRIAMNGFDVRERLSEVAVPTIVLHGSEDSMFKPEIGKHLADGLPSAEFRLVEGAAHGLPLTHPAQVIEAVRDLAGW
ncbi:MAG: alpha/beta hydrolase [Gemmatimonadetes bacterium]|nr:alpha/beta hydrolase [Gemmatimonadota bacterium]